MIVSYLLGRMIAPRREHAAPVVWLWGYCLAWALFEVVAVPSIYLGESLSRLTLIYMGILAAFVVLSLIICRKRIREDFLAWQSYAREGRFGPITVIAVADFLLIMAQAVFLFLYMHEDADDAEYIVMANDAVERDTLLATDPYTGFKWIDMSTKRMLSPFSTWIAVVARVTRMAPATLAHRYLPGLIVVLGYVAVFVAAGALLGGGDGASRKIGTAGSRRGDDDVMPDSRTAGIGGSAGGGRGGFASEGRLSAGVPWVALLFFQAMVIFGGATTRSYGSMLLLRAWQGKAVFCAVLLPLLLAELMEWGTDGSGDEGEMLLLWGGRILRLVVLSLASLLTTGMSIPMVPLLVGAFGLVYMGEEVLRRIKGNGN